MELEVADMKMVRFSEDAEGQKSEHQRDQTPGTRDQSPGTRVQGPERPSSEGWRSGERIGPVD